MHVLVFDLVADRFETKRFYVIGDLSGVNESITTLGHSAAAELEIDDTHSIIYNCRVVLHNKLLGNYLDIHMN
jgi:hypothetical protein